LLGGLGLVLGYKLPGDFDTTNPIPWEYFTGKHFFLTGQTVRNFFLTLKIDDPQDITIDLQPFIVLILKGIPVPIIPKRTYHIELGLQYQHQRHPYEIITSNTT
jgi:hypothetical protein